MALSTLKSSLLSRTITLCVSLLSVMNLCGQNVNDSLRRENLFQKYIHSTPDNYKFRPVQLILPTALITTGFIGLESHWMQDQNVAIRDEIQGKGHKVLKFDNYTQYAPYVGYYGLSLFGLKSRHNYVDRTLILGISTALMATSVKMIKKHTKVWRPDDSSNNSFPSGHTATAFMGAELLRIEYWNTSPWIGFAGYLIATETAFMRIYNNRHWLTDVIAGAGIGILSARVANWLFLLLSDYLLHPKSNNVAIMPFMENDIRYGNTRGLSLAISF